MANVLLVEPDRVLARHYRAALRKNAHAVTWRASGQTAIRAVERAVPDVILLELKLPGHNGLEFLYELRSYPEWQDIPVILLTLVSDKALTAGAAAKQLGISGYLYKPRAKLDHVVRAVNQLFDEEPIRYSGHSFRPR